MTEAAKRRQALRKQIREIERSLVAAQNQFVNLTAGDELAGLFLLVRFGSVRALLAADRILEVTQLVALESMPDTSPSVLGRFIYRGQVMVALSLARLMGVESRPSLDAHLAILAGSQHLALVVDRVEGLWESPRLVEGPSGEARKNDDGGWMLSAFCQKADETLPLLSLEAITSAGMRADGRAKG